MQPVEPDIEFSPSSRLEERLSQGEPKTNHRPPTTDHYLPTVGEVLRGFIRRPVENLLRRWNWKSAVLSACVRGALFFMTNLSGGWQTAFSAMALESAFYIVTAGFYGAMIQAFRRVRPAWLATLTVMILMPTVNHTFEFLLHWIGGTEKIGVSVLASICFSLFSAAFNLFAMRRGALIVGDEKRSLFNDLLQMPRLVFDFLLAIPRALMGSKKDKSKEERDRETREIKRKTRTKT